MREGEKELYVDRNAPCHDLPLNRVGAGRFSIKCRGNDC
jgi:hypothetical protein